MFGDPRSLLRYGLTVSGPRDFLINLAINTVVPAWLLLGRDSVGWYGDPSVLSLWGPMGFLLVFFTTFFGYLNGISQRQAGRRGDALPTGWWWLPIALPSALLRGTLMMIVFMGTVIVLAAMLGPRQFPSGLLMLAQGLFAGLFAYTVQVRGVLLADRLVAPPQHHP